VVPKDLNLKLNLMFFKEYQVSRKEMYRICKKNAPKIKSVPVAFSRNGEYLKFSAGIITLIDCLFVAWKRFFVR